MSDAEEQIWWARVDAAAKRQGLVGKPGVMADWSHDMLRALAPDASGRELLDGHWQPIRPERFTDEYKQAETRRLCDELGRKLGIGPMP